MNGIWDSALANNRS